jgi:WXXGXW repeat (2 copies)
VVGLAASALPNLVSARTYVDVDVAPPAAQVEVIGPARAGYAWAPGYYNYSGHQHVWVNGRYIQARQGHHWTADRWEQHGTHWRHEEGRWDRD